MRDGGRGRLVWYVLLLVVAAVAVVVVPVLTKSWPWVVGGLLGGVVVAIASGGTGTFLSEVITARRARVEARRTAVSEVEARRAELGRMRELVASDEESVAGLLRPERGVVGFIGREL
jgi:hypothetical protein